MNAKRRRAKPERKSVQSYDMSSKTKDFLQKICYKKTASVDMTQYGFMKDSKVTPVNLLMKPLREKLESICGPSGNSPPDNPTQTLTQKRTIKEKPIRVQFSKTKIRKPPNKAIPQPKADQIEETRQRRVRYEL